MIPMTESLGWTRTEFTLPRSIGQFVMALTGFLIGGYVDRFGARRFMLAGTMILAMALFATAYVRELWHWVLLNGFLLTTGAALIGNLVASITVEQLATTGIASLEELVPRLDLWQRQREADG